MAGFHPSDFALSIRYRHPNSGSYPRAAIPGFYVRAGFANEGDAEWVYDQRLLSPRSLLAIARETDIQIIGDSVEWPGVVSGREDGPLTAKVRPIADAGRKELEAAKAVAKRGIEENVARLEQIEAALKDA